MESNKCLTIATFMCPSVPVELYEMISCYLEESLKIKTCLLYDSMRPAPEKNKQDHLNIDLAFISATAFLDDFPSKNDCFKLLPVGCVTRHPVKGDVLGYFADIILRKDTSGSVKEFSDLRGFKWTFGSHDSISATKQVLLSLKQMGENKTFFSSMEDAGNHLNAIEMVLAKRADAAVVDSLSFANFKQQHYAHAPDLHLLTSLGPLPSHAIVINKNVPDALQLTIKDALLNIQNCLNWRHKLEQFNIVRFEMISLDHYLFAKELIETTKDLKVGVVYY